jgi:ribosomal protein S18 acetylase RimI-like enzyme
MKDVQDLMIIFENSDTEQKRPFNGYPFMEWILQQNRLVLIAEAPKGAKSGFIVVREKVDTASIDVIAVHKKSKTSEVKKSLVDAAMDIMKTPRIEYYGEKNDEFTKLLKSNGFEKIDEVHGMFGEGKDGVLLVKYKESDIPERLLQKKNRFMRDNLKKLDRINTENAPRDDYAYLSDF